MISKLPSLRHSSSSLGEYKIKRRSKNSQKQSLYEKTNIIANLPFYGTEPYSSPEEIIEEPYPVKKVKKETFEPNQTLKNLSPVPVKREEKTRGFSNTHYNQNFEKKHNETNYKSMNRGNSYKAQRQYHQFPTSQRYNPDSLSKSKNYFSKHTTKQIESKVDTPVEFSSQRLLSNLMSTTPVYSHCGQLIMVLPSALTKQ